MSEAFLKSLKWYVLVLFAVLGTSCFIVMDKTGSIRPIMLGVLSYGVAYIMTYFWKEFRKKVLFASIVVFLVLTVVAAYMPDILYVFFAISPTQYNIESGYDPYYIWAMTQALGIIPMTFIFYKYD